MKKLKFIVLILFLLSISFRLLLIYDTFIGIEGSQNWRLQQHHELWSFFNIANALTGILSLSGLIIYYWLTKQKQIKSNEVINILLIIYVLFEVAVSTYNLILSNSNNVFMFG